MKNYTILQQLQILLNCNNACELLTAKENITESQFFSSSAMKLYDVLMTSFLQNNLIA